MRLVVRVTSNDSYVNVYELLVSGADDIVLAEHLLRIVTDIIGLGGANTDAMRPTVTALRAIKLPSRLVKPHTTN